MPEDITKYEGSVKKIPFVDPFTGAVSKEPREVLSYPDFDYNQRALIEVELDKETGNTHVVISGYEDTDKLVQECVEDCGFVGMRKLIATGQARPIDFADDGRHGMDISGLPDNVNDAYRAAMASKADSQGLFVKLGVKPVFDASGNVDMDATEKAISQAIQKIFAEAAKPVEGKKDETK